MLLRHTLAYLPAQLLSPLLQFATAIVLTHGLAAAPYGLTMMVFAAQELVFLVCLSWWTTFFLRYGSGQGQVSPGLESAVLLASSAAQVVVSTLIVLLTEPGAGPALLAAACLFTTTRSLLGFLSERSRREAAIGAYTAVQIAAPAGGLALTLGLMALGAAGTEQVLLAFALMQALVGGLVVWRLGLWRRPAPLQGEVIKAAAAFGGPIVLANALCWLGGNSVRFVVQHGAGAAALGLFSVGWGLATRLTGVAAMLVTAAAYPLAVKAMQAGDVAGARRQIADNSALLLALLAPVTAGALALNEPFVRLLVGPEYHAATIELLPWAVLGAALRNLRMHGWDQLYLLNEAPKAMIKLDLIEAVLTTAAAALGLWWGGITGAVAGTAVAAVAVAAFDHRVLSQAHGLHTPWSSYARILLAACGVFVLLHAGLEAGLWGAAQWGSMGLAAAAGTLAYGLLLATLLPQARARLRQRLTGIAAT